MKCDQNKEKYIVWSKINCAERIHCAGQFKGYTRENGYGMGLLNELLFHIIAQEAAKL